MNIQILVDLYHLDVLTLNGDQSWTRCLLMEILHNLLYPAGVKLKMVALILHDNVLKQAPVLLLIPFS